MHALLHHETRGCAQRLLIDLAVGGEGRDQRRHDALDVCGSKNFGHGVLSVCVGWRGLLRLDAGELDQLGETGDFALDVGSKFSRARRCRLQAELQQPGLDLGRVDGLHGFGVEPGDDFGRRAGRSDDAVPGQHFVAGKHLCDGGHVGQQCRAPGRGHGDCLELAGLDVRHDFEDRAERQLDLAAQEIGVDLVAAAVRHAGHLDAGHRLEQHGGQMRRRADAGRSVVDLLRVRLEVRDKLLEVVRGHRRVHGQHARAGGGARDRDQVLDRVVGQRLVQADVAGHRAAAHEAQCVAVILCARNCRRADGAARAGLVVHHDLLAQALAHLLRDDAARHVVVAAGGERHDQLHGLAGITLGDGRHGEGRECAKRCPPHDFLKHRCLL